MTAASAAVTSPQAHIAARSEVSLAFAASSRHRG